MDVFFQSLSFGLFCGLVFAYFLILSLAKTIRLQDEFILKGKGSNPKPNLVIDQIAIPSDDFSGFKKLLGMQMSAKDVMAVEVFGALGECVFLKKGEKLTAEIIYHGDDHLSGLIQFRVMR